jgi:LDH2 family malate/lactate/ureidoglycolate dehydrogenase
LEKAAQQGMAIVSIVQCHHIGRLGEYAEMAAAKGMISMIWGGGYSEEAPAAVPFGGRARVLSTNPVAMGFPAGREERMMFDFATTSGSGVKINNAKRKGEPLPAGWIVDKDGNPTTNAADFFEGGAHMPFGGHKGYALMMGAEFLGRVFAGSDAYAEAGRGGPIMSHQGVTLIVFKANLFQANENYTTHADEMLERVRSIPPAPGFASVLAPGDPERRTRALREREGIPIPDDLWQELTALASPAGAA